MTNKGGTPGRQTIAMPALGLQAAPWFLQAGGERAGPLALATRRAVATQPFVTAKTTPRPLLMAPQPIASSACCAAAGGMLAPGRSQSWPCFDEGGRELVEP